MFPEAMASGGSPAPVKERLRLFLVRAASRIVNVEGLVIELQLLETSHGLYRYIPPDVAVDGSSEDLHRRLMNPIDELLFGSLRTVIGCQHLPYDVLCDKISDGIMWKEEFTGVEWAWYKRIKDLTTQPVVGAVVGLHLQLRFAKEGFEGLAS